LKLMTVPEHLPLALAPNDIIDHLLVGPCEHPIVLGQALIAILHEVGVSDPHNKVRFTQIPLRTRRV